MTQLASCGERQFWFAEQIAPGALAHLANQTIRLDGPVDVTALTEAFRAVVHRHEALGTGFLFHDGQLYRRPPRGIPPAVPMLLADHLTPESVTRKLLTPGLDLDTGDLIRMGVVPDASGALLHVVVHHVAFDGLSQEIFTRDLAAAYGARLRGEAIDLPVRPRMPAHVVDPARLGEQLAYWRGEVEGVPDLPGGEPAPLQWDLADARIVETEAWCDKATVHQLRAVARGQDVTLFTLLLTAYAQALGDIGGGDDFCVGVAVALRGGDRLDEVGCEINVLPMRMRRPRAPGAIGRVWASQVGTLSSPDLPFAELVASIQTMRGDRLPLMQTSLISQGWDRVVHRVGPVRMQNMVTHPLGSQFEVQALMCHTEAGDLKVVVQAPECSGWAVRLAGLATAVTVRLGRLATGKE
ncbi:condensation domain-containing protein [Micromonospora sp. NPDC051925]|uniref:condensation domain-containing protein n=1 Tax=Micromonospora sp. NPDC051925 TaxID=3364288 RepID=UPI0037C61912